jgi:hypothetical protein
MVHAAEAPTNGERVWVNSDPSEPQQRTFPPVRNSHTTADPRCVVLGRHVGGTTHTRRLPAGEPYASSLILRVGILSWQYSCRDSAEVGSPRLQDLQKMHGDESSLEQTTPRRKLTKLCVGVIGRSRANTSKRAPGHGFFPRLKRGTGRFDLVHLVHGNFLHGLPIKFCEGSEVCC